MQKSVITNYFVHHYRRRGNTKKGERIRVCRMSLPLQGPAVTYSPTLPGSTIGAGGLNGSVRYG